MKRILATIVMIGMISASLAGCVNPTKKADNGKITITVGGWPTKEGPELNSKNEALQRFNEKYGDTIEVVPDKWKFSVDTFLPKAASGQLPTLYHSYFTEVNRIVDAGYAADISNQMEEYGYIDKVSDYVKELITRDDKTYMIPISSYATGMLANLNILEEAGLMEDDGTPKIPKTYDELTEYAKIIKEKTGKAGFIMPTTNNNGGWHFTIIAWSYGVDFMENVNGKWQATFDTPECVAVLQWLKDLKWKYGVLNSNALIDMNEAQKLFATDQGAYYLSSTPSNTLISNYGMSKDDIGMGPIPAGPEKHVTLMGGNLGIVAPNATEEQKEAVFKWLEYDGATPKLTEASKTAMENSYISSSKENYLIGVPKFSSWNEKAETSQYSKELIKKYTNVNVNHVKQYGDFEGIQVQPEEPVCCQDLYGILDACIQAIFTDENADCATLIKNAASDFQANYLDNAK